MGARGGGVRLPGARGSRGDGHGGQWSGTSRIFFGVTRAGGMTTAVSGVSCPVSEWGRTLVTKH
jgi:hypothetical protein